MLKRIFHWFGIEANARAIMALIAIGGTLGVAGSFLLTNVAPLLSASMSATDFGEGYRRGKREAELESKLNAAEASLSAIHSRKEVSERVQRMSSEELKESLSKWKRD